MVNLMEWGATGMNLGGGRGASNAGLKLSSIRLDHAPTKIAIFKILCPVNLVCKFLCCSLPPSVTVSSGLRVVWAP